MRIEIRLNETCNYNCNYCTDMHDNSKALLEFDMIGLYNLLNELYKHNQRDNEVFIYGGEPTLYPGLDAIVKYLKQSKVKIIIQTNGSNPEVFNSPVYDHCKINYSYHSQSTTLKEFVKNISSKHVNEIAYMGHEDADYSEYLKLKKIFKNVQFCPIINSSTSSAPSTKHLRTLEHQKIFDNIKQDYHFKKQHNVQQVHISNYDIWKDNISSKNNLCKTQFSTLHIQNNKVYDCFVSMNRDINGQYLSDYKYEPKIIQCTYEYCYFGMENWIHND